MGGTPLRRLIYEHPDVEKWITWPYSLHGIQTTILQFRNNKATGTDGIPGGGIYKAVRKHLSSFLMELMNSMTQGQQIPDQRAEGAIIHIRNKETAL